MKSNLLHVHVPLLVTSPDPVPSIATDPMHVIKMEIIECNGSIPLQKPECIIKVYVTYIHIKQKHLGCINDDTDKVPM